ncbi:hypothetical protein AALA36_12540, partial [Lachnospiraceae bacterium 66-29]
KLQQANVFHDVLCLEQRERNGYKNENKSPQRDLYFDGCSHDFWGNAATGIGWLFRNKKSRFFAG